VRPVNLIPVEERSGNAPALRAGPVAYLLVAVLVAGLVAVTALVLSSNQITEKKAEVASLKQRESAAAARAEALAPYAEFADLATAREQTVRSLAQSRFDWERVLNELALVIPQDVWLTDLAGTASPAAQVEGGGSLASRAQIPGPALELTGCAPSQDAVAGFLTALRDIDGVTRVGLDSSERPDTQSSGGAAPTAGGDADASCQTRDFIVQFQILAAFDEVPVPAAAAVPAPTAPATTAPATEAETAPGGGTTEQQAARDSAAEQTQDAEQAVNVIGVVR
jgi:Tfp pilus assembly protein PilN